MLLTTIGRESKVCFEDYKLAPFRVITSLLIEIPATTHNHPTGRRQDDQGLEGAILILPQHRNGLAEVGNYRENKREALAVGAKETALPNDDGT